MGAAGNGRSVRAAIGEGPGAGDGHANARRSSIPVDMMNSMAKMDRDMQRAPMTGDPDHNFAAIMIPHHQGAIDMARAELLHGKDPVLRRIEQEIITTQNSEIQLMQQLATLPAGRKAGHGAP